MITQQLMRGINTTKKLLEFILDTQKIFPIDKYNELYPLFEDLVLKVNIVITRNSQSSQQNNNQKMTINNLFRCSLCNSLWIDDTNGTFSLNSKNGIDGMTFHSIINTQMEHPDIQQNLN